MENFEYTQSYGSEWSKWDLHLHTPKSSDYKDKSVTVSEIINALKSNNIRVAGITDHHIIDIEYIRELQRLAGNEITILPGVEIRTSGGGAENIHLIGIFKEDSNDAKLEKIQSDLFSKGGINDQKEKGRNDNEIYVDLKTAFSIIRDNGGISIIHCGSKSSGLDSETTNSLPYGQALKADISENVDIFEVGKLDDVNDYKKYVFTNISPRPIILSSDNHNIKDYENSRYTWIKADPSFEGLRQTLYEPEERVSYKEPVSKKSYNIIKSISINSPEIYNKTICFSPYLNTIIGGRSSGKSLLLASIAKKNNTENKAKSKEMPYAEEYENFVQSIADNLQINWADLRDEQDAKEREIEYFRQDYMYSFAKNSKKRDSFIEGLIQKESNSHYQNYNSSNITNRKTISFLLNQYFIDRDSLKSKQAVLKSKGDPTGIANEINRLEKLKNEIVLEAPLSEDEMKKYSDINEQIYKLNEKNKEYNNDLKNVYQLKNLKIAEEKIYIDDFSNESKERIDEEYRKIAEKANNAWHQFIVSFESDLINKLKETSKSIDEYTKNPVYKKGIEFYKRNKALAENAKLLEEERAKLNDITDEKGKIERFEDEIKSLLGSIIEKHIAYHSIAENFSKELNIPTHDIKIIPCVSIRKREIKNFLISFLNQKNQEQAEFIKKIDECTFDSYKEFIKEISNLVFFEKLIFKTGNDIRSFFTKLIEENFCYIEYKIEYDNDDFNLMSEGKKAFVMLKMLLEYSDKKCPILIDQPEDDLDNRAIFTELVSYLKSKKEDRQIILVTHNPNIVVATDSELVIVANQNGTKNKNREDKKFAYISGPIENRFDKRETDITLESQGIREHICEILEGGIEAFRKREKRYFIENKKIDTWK